MATALPYPINQADASSKTNVWLLRLFPSLTDLAFLLPLWLLFSGLKNTNALLADGDTGWHIRTGDWILQHGQVPHQDIFSFTKAGQPWFAWEWGWDVLASLVHSQWGLPGIVLVNAVIVGLMSAFLFRLVRRHTENQFLALGISILATVVSSIHWLARPHLLAWLFALVFLDVIDRYERTSSNHLWILPPLMLLWTNLHGSFFIGIVFLLTYAVVEAAQCFLTADKRDFRKPLNYLLCAAACGAMVILWTHLSLCIARNILIYLFISAPVIAAFLHDALQDANRSANPTWLQRSITGVRTFGSEFAQFESTARIPLISAAGVCIAAVLAGVVPNHSALAADFDPKIFPMKTVPVIEKYSDARIFTHDQWGDYLIYKLYPHNRVFVDGRSDFYGIPVLEDGPSIVFRLNNRRVSSGFNTGRKNL